MAFNERLPGFSQQHYMDTESSYCPSGLDLVWSPVTLDLTREDVKTYNTPSPHHLKNDIFNSVVRDAFYAFKIPKVRPFHLNDIPKIPLETAGSSPGFPWKQLGYQTKGQVLRDPKAFECIRKFWHIIKEGGNISPTDCDAYLQSHLVKKVGVKVRAVREYPATIGFQEACFALPLISAYKQKGLIACGYETAHGGCRKIANRFANHQNILCSDFKSFNKRIPPWLIRIAFDVLLFNITFTEYEREGVPIAPKLHQAWMYLVDYFINSSVRLCNGKRYRKRKGVASGSYFTLLVDSIVNWIVTTYALRSSSSQSVQHNFLCTKMAFNERLLGFSQQHYMDTDSSYYPNGLDLVWSPVTLDLTREDVKTYNTPSPHHLKNEIFNSVVRDAFYAFKIPKVRPFHLNDIPKIPLETAGSSPGFPWTQLGYQTKGQVLRDPKAFECIRKFWHIIKEGGNISPTDCDAYLQSHLVKKVEVKVRAVREYPATIGFQEACFALPLISAYKQKDLIVCGYENAHGGCIKIANRFANNQNILCSDFKSFNKRIPPWLIRIAFDVLLFNITFTEYEREGVPIAPKLHQAWMYLVHYFINSSVRLCNGKRYRKRKGVASGSYFTLLVDSIVNWIVTTYALRSSSSQSVQYENSYKDLRAKH